MRAHGVSLAARPSAVAWPARATAIVLVAWASSRALVFGTAWLVELVGRRNPRLVGGSGGPLIGTLTSWDGWWYLGIARDGYHAAPLAGAYHDYAFFPLWPALIRALSLPWPAFDGIVAVLAANLLFLLALLLLYRLTADVLDEDRAVTAVVVLAVFPFAWVFSMAYGESLFLALSLGAFLAAERGRPAPAAILGMLAAATRLQGALLVLPLGVVLWRRVPDRRRLAVLALVPLGALAFAAYVAFLTGSPAGYSGAQAAWGRDGVAGAAAAGGALGSHLDPLRASFLVTLLGYVFLFVFVRADRIPPAYVLVAFLAIAAAFASGNLESIGRYGIVAFPFAWILAGRRSQAFRRAWPAVSAGLGCVLAAAAFAGWYTP